MKVSFSRIILFLREKRLKKELFLNEVTVSENYIQKIERF